MRTDTEKEYLLKAIDAFRRKIVVISKDYRILAGSDHIVGDGDMIGELCHKMLYERDEPCDHCPAVDVIKTKKPSLRQGHCSNLDGDKMPCIYSYPIFSEDEVDAFVMFDFDIPTLGLLEEELHRSNAFLRNLILSSVDGVIAADKKGRIIMFNEAAQVISGYTMDEALNEIDIRDVYPDDGAREVMKKLRSEDYGGKGKLKSCKVEVLTKEGQTIPISLNASIVYEGEKEVATIGFFHDLREKIRMKRELEKTQIQLLQAEKMASLGKLAAGVAHQLNNPLGGIILFTKLVLEEYELPEKAVADLDRILKDAQRCRDTVKELLEFARQTRQEMRSHDINQAISRTLFLLENQTLFHNIEIVKKLDQTIPPFPSDIQQMNHLFMNIILNAAQAMDGQGRLTVTTRLSDDGKRAHIEISDTGPGIPENILPHIFDPFFTTKEEGKGTGLGLSLVYGIVENHNGHISVRSKLGEGATFIIELPLENQENGGGAKWIKEVS